jgi:hypothetical protein
MRSSYAVVCVLSTSLFACGGTTPTATSAPAVAAPAKPAVSAPPDLSPVQAPPDLVAVVTVKNAQALQGSIRDIAADAFPAVRQVTVEALAQSLLGPALSDVVHLSEPIDVAFLGSFESVAASFGLASLDDAKQNLAEDFDLTPGQEGVIGLSPHKGADPNKLLCEIRPSAGQPAYRLICATQHTTLRALAPYMARTLPRESTSEEALVRFFPVGLADKIKGDGTAATPFEALGRKMGSEAMADTQALSLGASVGGDPVEAFARATFRSAESPITRTLLAQADVKGPPPDLFWRLPADSLGALYTVGGKADDLAPLQGVLLDSFAKFLGEDGASDEAVARGRKAMSSMFLTGGPLSLAYGFDLPAALAAITAETPGHHADRRVLHGWLVAGVQEPTARWIDGFRELNLVDRLPSKKAEGHASAEPPKKTVTIGTEEKVTDPKLGPQAAHFVFSDYPQSGGKRASKPTTVNHIFIVTDGDRTWIALGENQSQLVGKLKEILSGGAGLAGRGDLGSLHASTGFAGFVSAGLFDALGSPDDASEPTKVRAFFDQVSGSKDIETTPMVFLMSGADGAAKTAEVRALASRAIIKGLLARAH